MNNIKRTCLSCAYRKWTIVEYRTNSWMVLTDQAYTSLNTRPGLRGGTGGTCLGPPSSKGPPATEKKTVITIFNNANVIKVRQI